MRLKLVRGELCLLVGQTARQRVLGTKVVLVTKRRLLASFVHREELKEVRIPYHSAI